MTTKTPKFVQLRANYMVDGCVEPAQHRDEVEFFSIYLGKPGDYQWVADYECHTTMLNVAHHLVKAFGCAFDCSQYDAVMQTPAPEPHPQPKGHPHAALMAEYAKDAAETETPWERWESRLSNGEWYPMRDLPRWETDVQYRRKPKTITVNGFEVPAPLDKVSVGTTVYVANPASADLCVEVTYVSWHCLYFDRKIVHTNREAAVAHAKAMLGIDPSK